MIFYWENHTDLVVSTYGGPQFFYGSSETPTATPVGIWMMNLDNEQVVYWQDHVDVLSAGAFRAIWAPSSAAPAVAAIIYERGVARFMFSRIFGRVN